MRVRQRTARSLFSGALFAVAVAAAGCGGGGPGGGGTTTTTASNAAGSLTVTIGSASYTATVSSCTKSGNTLTVAGTAGGRPFSLDVPLGNNSVLGVLLATTNYVGTGGSVTDNGNNYSGSGHGGAPVGAVNGTFDCTTTGDNLVFNNLTFGVPTGSTTLPSVPGAGGSANLTFTVGGTSDGTTSASVVCLQGNVATSAGEFFFDIVGTTTGGKTLVFSGKLHGYTGPGSYPAPPAGIIFDYGGTPYAGVANFRPESGRIIVGAGGTSGSFSSLKIPAANPNVTGDVTVNGPFTCTSYTTAT